jgi:hypothetical protein
MEQPNGLVRLRKTMGIVSDIVDSYSPTLWRTDSVPISSPTEQVSYPQNDRLIHRSMRLIHRKCAQSAKKPPY